MQTFKKALEEYGEKKTTLLNVFKEMKIEHLSQVKIEKRNDWFLIVFVKDDLIIQFLIDEDKKPKRLDIENMPYDSDEVKSAMEPWIDWFIKESPYRIKFFF